MGGMMDRREEILQGILSFPVQIMEKLNPANEIEENNILEFFEAVWFNFLREKETSTIVWYEQFNDKNLFNNTIIWLSKAGWITSCTEASYAFIKFNESKVLKWITKEELIEIKRDYKFLKYRFKASVSRHSNIVKLSHHNAYTGIVRKGFCKAGNHKFQYDTKYLQKYINEIADNVCKGLEASTKDVTYEEVICELLAYYSNNENEYSLGENISDSRGRAIYQCMKKIFNPISCKDARALIKVAPRPLTEAGRILVYAAVAEMMSIKPKNFNKKVEVGKELVEAKALPCINEMRMKSDYSDLHNRIWLERIYDNLDNYDGTNWTTPIELDATASMLQVIGAITNDHFYLNATNVIGGILEDPWTIDASEIEISREHIKKALTPILYGSSKAPKELWDKNKLEYNQKQVNFVMKEIESGRYANANQFKNFIINNVNPKTQMKVEIYNDTFIIECNRFKWEQTTKVRYPIYNTEKNLIENVVKEVTLVPDVNQFKRYFVTLLIHNLDSQIANNIANEMNWVLPNHDAFICHPNDGMQVKKLYVNELYKIYLMRKDILHRYFNSIGITEEYLDKDTQLINEFKHTCLK